MNKLKVCPCVRCQIDNDHGHPLAVATWAEDGMYWAPYRDLGDGKNGFYEKRGDASAFGPRHADEIRRNHHFVVAMLDKSEMKLIRSMGK